MLHYLFLIKSLAELLNLFNYLVEEWICLLQDWRINILYHFLYFHQLFRIFSLIMNMLLDSFKIFLRVRPYLSAFSRVYHWLYIIPFLSLEKKTYQESKMFIISPFSIEITSSSRNWWVIFIICIVIFNIWAFIDLTYRFYWCKGIILTMFLLWWSVLVEYI